MEEDRVVRRIRHMCQVIEALGQELQEARAENKRLREALENCGHEMVAFGNVTNWPREMSESYVIAVNDARAALKGSSDE